MASSPEPDPKKYQWKAGDVEWQPGSETAKRVKLSTKGARAKLKKLKNKGK